MDCRIADQGLVAFHLGRVDATARDALETHLMSCAACRAAYFTVKRCAESTAHAAEEPSPAALAAVLAALPPGPQRWLTPVRLATAGAALTLLVAVGSWRGLSGARPPSAAILPVAAPLPVVPELESPADFVIDDAKPIRLIVL